MAADLDKIKETKRKSVQSVIQKLIDNNIDFCIIGGYCRYLCNMEPDYKDVDIVTNTDINLRELFPEADTNPYNGLELPFCDVWDIKNNIIPSKSFEELYDNYFISYDAIMYHPYTNTWYTKNFSYEADINEKVEDRQKHDLCVEKLIRLEERGIKLTQKAKDYINKHSIGSSNIDQEKLWMYNY